MESGARSLVDRWPMTPRVPAKWEGGESETYCRTADDRTKKAKRPCQPVNPFRMKFWPGVLKWLYRNIIHSRSLTLWLFLLKTILERAWSRIPPANIRRLRTAYNFFLPTRPPWGLGTLWQLYCQIWTVSVVPFRFDDKGFRVGSQSLFGNLGLSLRSPKNCREWSPEILVLQGTAIGFFWFFSTVHPWDMLKGISWRKEIHRWCTVWTDVGLTVSSGVCRQERQAQCTGMPIISSGRYSRDKWSSAIDQAQKAL
jgi:hypothetical protein